MEKSSIVSITAYHGTDEKYVNNIITGEFKINRNKTHWLGNGIYFFLNRSLAEWWAQGQSRKYGTKKKNDNPAVIKVEIECEDVKLLDTNSPFDYDELVEQFPVFMQEMTEKGKITIEEDELRCSFFEWFADRFSIEVFIAGFSMRRFQDRDIRNKLKIYYNQYQLCLFNQDLIVSKERIEI